MNMHRILKCFKQGNVCVVGLRGCGKDMLFANVVSRRKQPYISNTDYHAPRSPFIKLSFDKLNIKNNYKNFISDDIVPYDYPYPENADIYIADCGIYLPSQYCNELNKLYPEFPAFYALSRHIGNNNVHFNVQNLNRVWDKLREQSDTFIRTVSCHVLFKKWVVQTVVIYDKYQSCVDRVDPFKASPMPLFGGKESRAAIRQSNDESKRRYREIYGEVKKLTLVYKNKSNYDTRLFKGVLSREKN